MTTSDQPPPETHLPVYWDSERYVPKSRFWFPAPTPPDLTNWFENERARFFPFFRELAAGAPWGSVGKDPRDTFENVSMISVMGDVPAELILEEELAPLWRTLIAQRIWDTAHEKGVAPVTKPRFWVWRGTANFLSNSYGVVAASICVSPLDTEVKV